MLSAVRCLQGSNNFLAAAQLPQEGVSGPQRCLAA